MALMSNPLLRLKPVRPVAFDSLLRLNNTGFASVRTVVVSSHFAGDLLLFQGPLQSQTKRNLTTGKKTKSPTHYYDVLGLTPQATQGQIKSAYYQQSKLHHPDVSTKSNSHSVFREITEAYEVLGNITKRRMYDKGFRVNRPPGQGSQSGAHGAEYTYENRNSNFERGDRPPPPTGRSRVYNFDEFYRQHYNEMRQHQRREHLRRKQWEEENKKEGGRAPAGFPVGLTFPLVLFFLSYISSRDHDVDRLSHINRKHRIDAIDGPETETRENVQR